MYNWSPRFDPPGALPRPNGSLRSRAMTDHSCCRATIRGAEGIVCPFTGAGGPPPLQMGLRLNAQIVGGSTARVTPLADLMPPARGGIVAFLVSGC
jgi:hypothetical protein